LNAEKLDFVAKVVTHVNAAVVVTQLQAGGATGGEGPEVFLDSLSKGIERFEPSRFLDGMDADTVRGAMIDGSENGYGPFLVRAGRGGVSTPHLVWHIGDDGAFVRVGMRRSRLSGRGKQLMLPE
jgi:hypothetical protein